MNGTDFAAFFRGTMKIGRPYNCPTDEVEGAITAFSVNDDASAIVVTLRAPKDNRNGVMRYTGEAERIVTLQLDAIDFAEQPTDFWDRRLTETGFRHQMSDPDGCYVTLTKASWALVA